MQQGDASGPIGIIFNSCNPGGDAGLIPTEIDDAIGPLMTTAAVASCDPPVVVAPAALLERYAQRLLPAFVSQIAVIQLDHEATTRRIGFVLL